MQIVLWGSFKPAGAGPLPVGRLLDQSSTNRVEMDVIQNARQGPRLDDVPVVAAAGLPEQSFDASIPLSGYSGEPLGGVFLEVQDRSTTDGLFHGLQDRGDRRINIPGPNDEVDVLWHENIRPDFESQSLACSPDRIGQPLTGPIGREELVSMATGERQLMDMARFVKAPAPMLTCPVIHVSARLGRPTNGHVVPGVTGYRNPCHPDET